MCCCFSELSFDATETDLRLRIRIAGTFYLISIRLSSFGCGVINGLRSLKNAEVSMPFGFKVLTFELEGGEPSCTGRKVGRKLHIFNCSFRAKVKAVVNKYDRR